MQRRLSLLLAFVLATIPLAAAQALPITVSFDVDLYLVHFNIDGDVTDAVCGSHLVPTTDCGRGHIVIQTTNSGIDTFDFYTDNWGPLTPALALDEIRGGSPSINYEEHSIVDFDAWFAQHPHGVLFEGDTSLYNGFSSIELRAYTPYTWSRSFFLFDSTRGAAAPFGGNIIEFFTGTSNNEAGQGAWFTIDEASIRIQGVPEPNGLLVILGAMVIAGIARWSTRHSS